MIHDYKDVSPSIGNISSIYTGIPEQFVNIFFLARISEITVQQ